MPFYQYSCRDCKVSFEKFLRMDNREIPLKEPCPNCESTGTIKQDIVTNFELMAPDQLGRVKPHGDWQNFLQNLKRKNPGSDFNTY